MSPTTSHGRCLPTRAQPPQQGRSTQALCCARLMAAGLHLLQKPASILLSGRLPLQAPASRATLFLPLACARPWILISAKKGGECNTVMLVCMQAQSIVLFGMMGK